MTAELLELLEDHQPFHSEFQLERFVLAMNGGTVYGCYKQALRALRTRFEALKEDWYELEKIGLDLEAEEATVLELAKHAGARGLAVKNGPDNIPIRRHALEAKRLRMKAEALEDLARDRAREFAHLLGLVRGYRRMLGAPLSPERRAEYEREAWVHHIKCAAAAHYIAIPPGAPCALPAEVASMIQALPPEMRLAVCAEVAAAPVARTKLLGWWLDFAATVPEAEAVSEEEIRRLVWLTPSPLPSSGS